jgi:hypothetical protein
MKRKISLDLPDRFQIFWILVLRRLKHLNICKLVLSMSRSAVIRLIGLEVGWLRLYPGPIYIFVAATFCITNVLIALSYFLFLSFLTIVSLAKKPYSDLCSILCSVYAMYGVYILSGGLSQ